MHCKITFGFNEVDFATGLGQLRLNGRHVPGLFLRGSELEQNGKVDQNKTIDLTQNGTLKGAL